MPGGNLTLAKLPTKKNDFIAQFTRKIDETEIDVFQKASVVLYLGRQTGDLFSQLAEFGVPLDYFLEISGFAFGCGGLRIQRRQLSKLIA